MPCFHSDVGAEVVCPVLFQGLEPPEPRVLFALGGTRAPIQDWSYRQRTHCFGNGNAPLCCCILSAAANPFGVPGMVPTISRPVQDLHC